MTSDRPAITPDTRVGELLEAYPELEATLVGLAPAFERLRNPILRRTVAKVATLQQAARIGGLEVRDLVAQLRRAAGQPALDGHGDGWGAGGQASGFFENAAPGWFDEGRVEPPIDADRILASGEHPLGVVRRRLTTLEPGRILAVTAGFVLLAFGTRRRRTDHAADEQTRTTVRDGCDRAGIAGPETHATDQ